MKAMAFDGITRELGEVSTRRSFFRLFGGAAAVAGGLALTAGAQIQAKGKTQGKAKSQGQVKAQGKAKKITICYQGQTRKVAKRGWQQQYPGATLGPCPVTPAGPNPGQPQPVVCTSWILSGGPDRTTPIKVDDDFQVQVNGGTVLLDADGKASTVPPIVFPAQVGSQLDIFARDVSPSCRSLSPLWLHCATTEQKRQLTAGNNDGCAPGRTAGTFFYEIHTVSV